MKRRSGFTAKRNKEKKPHGGGGGGPTETWVAAVVHPQKKTARKTISAFSNTEGRNKIKRN